MFLVWNLLWKDILLRLQSSEAAVQVFAMQRGLPQRFKEASIAGCSGCFTSQDYERSWSASAVLSRPNSGLPDARKMPAVLSSFHIGFPSASLSACLRNAGSKATTKEFSTSQAH
jgi:hypothetical protein